MDYEKLKKFKIWNILDEVVEKKRFRGKRRDSFYPSEASVVGIDPKTKKASILGGCLRKSWYRFFKFQESNPVTLKSQYIFRFGDMVESFITQLIKEAGIYNNSSVKFWDASTGVSGEIDVVCNVPVSENGEYVIVEVKSTWGGSERLSTDPLTGDKKFFEAGKAKDLFDHPEGMGKNRKMIKATPKESNLLQLCIYLYNNRDDDKLIGGKLIYMLRDNLNRTEFDVVLKKNKKGKHEIYVNGDKEKRFVAEDIYKRFSELASHIKTTYKDVKKKELSILDVEPPPRDYSIEYSDDEALEKFKAGEISKTKYENHTSGKFKAGDWQCSYCNYRDLCWGKEVAF